jgi:hypothetical protein
MLKTYDRNTNKITKLNQDIKGIRMILKGTPYMPQKTIISYFDQMEEKERERELLQIEHIRLTGKLFFEPKEESKEVKSNSNNSEILVELKSIQELLQKLTTSLLN